jgi:hypothetical protein
MAFQAVAIEDADVDARLAHKGDGLGDAAQEPGPAIFQELARGALRGSEARGAVRPDLTYLAGEGRWPRASSR